MTRDNGECTLHVSLKEVLSCESLISCASPQLIDFYKQLSSDSSADISASQLLLILQDLNIIAVPCNQSFGYFARGVFRSPILILNRDSNTGLYLSPRLLRLPTLPSYSDDQYQPYILFSRLPLLPISKFKFAWLQFYPQWQSYLITLIFLLLGASISVLPVLAIDPIFSSIVPRGELPSLLLIGTGLILAQFIGSVSSSIASIFSTLVEQDIRYRSFISIVDRYLLARPLSLPKREAGLWSQTFKTALAFTNSIKTLSVSIPLAVFTIAINCIVFGVALAQPWVIALLLFLCTIPAIINVIFGWRTGKIAFGLVSINSRIDQHLFNSFRTISDARSLGVTNSFNSRFYNLRQDLNEITLRINAWSEAGIFLNSLLGSLLIAVILFLYSESNGISQGSYLVIFVAFSSVSSGFTKLAESISQILASAPTYFSKNAIRDLNQFCGYNLSFSKLSDSEDIKIQIEIRKVSFCYNTQEPLLQNISYKFINGSTAIIGSPGSGKSTLLKILGGLYLPTQGSVLVNDIPNTPLINQLDQFNVMYVPQVGRLLGSTIRDFFDPSFQYSDEQILSAIGQVGLNDLFSQMHMGLSTVISELSSDLSSGQVQFLQAARVVLHRPSVLLSDEPTSFLTEDEHLRVIQLLNSSCKLHVSTLHRLSAKSLFTNVFSLDL
ncbi:ATP-binding cassette domain-containing protein [Prochlorococcus marinus]|uniref:ATP-binding cassette domain-containing protein n=1 Tax=Prochlorococcus TaxID=1218 RepID=UPI0007BBB602|nr:ATP-binding cassette domain-containing protein [Prochlorococcus marinus]KZR77525.1 Lactococcin-G-processing and transport ATP-binding protein LagD [Prochlorococcus marinus str. MIT 1323]